MAPLRLGRTTVLLVGLAGIVPAWPSSRCLGSLAESKRPDSESSLEAIRLAVAEGRRRVPGLLVEGLIPKPGGEQTRQLLVVQGHSRYARLSHFSAEMPERLDLLENRVTFDGESLSVYYPALGWYETSRRNARLPFSWKVRAPLFLECLGWWPPTDETPPPRRGVPFFLHEALAEPGYRLLPRPERIDGAVCQVVERPGVDRIWFDPALGFAPRRREWFEGTPAVRTAEYRLSEFQKFGRALWLPKRVRRILYDPSFERGSAPTSRVLEDSTFAVLRLEVNRVGPGWFRFTPPAGTLVNDQDADSITQVPGGLAFLDSVVERARARRARDPGPPRVGGAGRGSTLLAITLVLGASDLILVWGLFRDSSRPRLARRPAQVR